MDTRSYVLNASFVLDSLHFCSRIRSLPLFIHAPTILAHRVVEHSETKWGISRLRAGHESSGIIHLLPVHRCICVAVRIEGSWRLLAM
jgi:hypothetical protein